MRTLRVVIASLLVTVSVAGCTSSTSESEVVKGFDGGCTDGIVLYVQNQFEPYGATIRDEVDQASEGATAQANERYVATGWFDTGEALYPDNPELIQGRVWYYVPDLNAWIADVSVRSMQTTPAPDNSDDAFESSQAAPRPDECELTR